MDNKSVVYTGRNEVAKKVFNKLNNSYFSFVELNSPTISNLDDYRLSFKYIPKEFEEFLFTFSTVSFMGIKIFDGATAGVYSQENLPSNYECFCLFRNQYLACFDSSLKDSKVYVVIMGSFEIVEEFDNFWLWFSSVVEASACINKVKTEPSKTELNVEHVKEDITNINKNDFINDQYFEKEIIKQNNLLDDILSLDKKGMVELYPASENSRNIYSQYEDILPLDFLEFSNLYNGGTIGNIKLIAIEENDYESEKIELDAEGFIFAKTIEDDYIFYDINENCVSQFSQDMSESFKVSESFYDWLKEVIVDENY